MEIELAKNPYMDRPKGKGNWIIRKRVPKELRGIMRKEFIQKTLCTPDLAEANRRFSRV